VGVAATFSVVSSLAPERRTALAEAALREPYPELQAAAFEALAGARGVDRPDLVVQHFPSLAPPVRDRMVPRADVFLAAARALLGSPRDGTRRAALETLAYLGHYGALGDLLGALKDPSPAVREAASTLLESLGARYLYHLVSHRMYADAESRAFVERHRRALEASLGPLLREYGSHGKKVFLEIALESDPIPEELLAETVFARRDGPAWKVLIQVLTESASERALHYLLRLHLDPAPRFRGVAEEVFARRKDAGFPRLLASVLGKLAPAERDALAQKFRDLPGWSSVEAAPDLEPAAAETLMAFVAAAALPREVRDERILSFRRSPYPEVRARVLGLLQNLESPQAASVAVASLGDPSDEVKLAAARAVIALGHPDKQRLLLPLLGAESEDLRRLVQREVARTSFDRFFQAFDRIDPRTRETAARALAKIDARILDRLAEQVGSLDADRRLKALRIVESIDAEKDLRETLMDLLGDPDRRVRATALKIVKLTENEAGLRLLRGALSDPDRRVRANAIEAFEDARDPSCVPVILPYVADPDNRVRANAAKALVTFGRPEGCDALEAMLRDPDETMRLSAAWAIGQVPFGRGRVLLEERLQEEPSAAVQARIREALAAIAGAAAS
jgi:hypothetical protein